MTKYDILKLVIAIACIIGEVKCIIKFFQCDFKEPYKREIIYGVSMCCGIGAVVGYLDIEE